MNKKPKATVDNQPENYSGKKEIPNVIKARNFEIIYASEPNNSKVVDDLPRSNNDSATKLGPIKKGNSISKLIKAFEEKKEKNREAAAANLPDTENKPHEVSKVTASKKSSKPDRETTVVEIVNRPQSSSENRKEEEVSNMEKDFQNRISKLIKKFEATPEPIVPVESDLNAKSESIKLNYDKKRDVKNDANDTDDEVEISHITYSEVVPKSEQDIINDLREPSNNTNADSNTFTVTAKSRLTEKQNKQENKKSSNKPV